MNFSKWTSLAKYDLYKQLEKDLKLQIKAEMAPEKEFELIPLKASVKEAKARISHPNELEGISTGYSNLDKLLGGICPEELVVVAGGTGQGKCLGWNTPIMMSDGSVKMVQDIRVGDLIMGDDSTPRHIISTTTGKENMYRIVPKKGESFEVNESHILSLVHTVTGEKIDIELREYLSKSNKFKHLYKGYRVPVDFPEKHISIDPYFFGLWLGDGSSNDTAVTTMDKEVVAEINLQAEKYGLRVWERPDDRENKSSTYYLNGTRGRKNPIREILRKYNVWGNKHIPLDFISNTAGNRLELLAGLIDSDGYVNKPSSYCFCNKNIILAGDVAYLAQTLGFGTSMRTKVVNGEEYYIVSIFGDCSTIPVRIERKKCQPRRQKKDVLRFGFDVEPIGVDYYYGFEIDGNRRFLLGDCTVTHNTQLVQCIIENMALDNNPTLFFTLEMPPVETTIRFMRMIKSKIHESILPELPIYYYYGTNVTLPILEKAIQKGVEMGIKCVVIDHIHFFAKGNDNQAAEIGNIAREIKLLARKYKLPIILIAHIRKTGNPTKIPSLDDIKDSSGVAQDADSVLVVWRDMESDDEITQRELKVKVRKNRRRGELGGCQFLMDKNTYLNEVEWSHKEEF